MTKTVESRRHYLQHELYQLVHSDPAIFDFLQSGSLDGVWYWDLENPDHEWMSARFWELFGYDPATKEHKAAEWQDMIHSEDLKTALDNFYKHCEDPNHPYDQMVRYTHASGSTVWVRCRGLAIRDAEGKPVRMLGAHTDVTQLKLREQELERLSTRLQASNEQLEEFAAITSHDLRQPLRAITGFIQILTEQLEDRLTDEEREYMTYVADGSRRMQRMIDEMMSLSRVKGSQVEWGEFSLDDAVAEASESLSVTLAESGATVEAEDLPVVNGDAGLVARLLQNLIDNAIKYARPGVPPHVRVTAERADHGWVVSVADNGVGMKQAYLERIFRPFHRGAGSKPKEGDSIGVGLSICKRIARAHGGDMRVESVLGEGSTFRFTLPPEPPADSR